jgi:hypothetical protein
LEIRVTTVAPLDRDEDDAAERIDMSQLDL